MEKELESEIISEKQDVNKFLGLSKFFRFFKKDATSESSFKNTNKKLEENVKNKAEQQEVSKEKQLLITKFNQFFELDKTFYWLEMLKNGYEPNIEQKEKIQKFMSYSLRLDHGLYVEYLLHVGFKLSLEDKENYFKKVILDIVNKNSMGEKNLSLDFFLKNNYIMTSAHHAEFGIRLEKEEQLPLLTIELKNFIMNESPNFGKKLFDILTQNILTQNTRSNIQNNSKELICILNGKNKNYVLKNVTFDELFNFMYNLKEKEKIFYTKDLNDIIDKILHYDYQDGYNKILEKTKEEYTESYIKVITVNSIIENTKTMTVTKLPKLAKDIIKEIDGIYKNINASTEIISEEDRFVLKNLIEVRIPEVLKKYLVLDDEFKTTFKNVQNQNAEEVMIQSLNDFKTRFDKTWKEINELRFSSLNVSGKYAKEIKSM